MTPRGSGDHQPMGPERPTGIGKSQPVGGEERAGLEIGADADDAVLVRGVRRREAPQARGRIDGHPVRDDIYALVSWGTSA